MDAHPSSRTHPMQIKRGDIVSSDFGTGRVVAITKSWVIHEDERGTEVAISRENDVIVVPATFPASDVDEAATMDVEQDTPKD